MSMNFKIRKKPIIALAFISSLPFHPTTAGQPESVADSNHHGAPVAMTSAENVPDEDVEAFKEEAISGDYDHLLRTCMEWVGKCKRDGKCPNPNYVTQGRYVFETEWAEVSR